MVTQTRVIALDPERFDAAALAPAAAALREGELVAMPTETVYGIAVNAAKPEAVRRLLEVRESPAEKHLTVHVADRDDVRKLLGGPVPPAGQRLIRKFWPGPLTIVFPTPDGKGIGVRYPNHRVACELVRQAGVRVVAPSANLSGRPPALTAEEVLRTFEGKVGFLLDSGPTRHKSPSTVARVNGSRVEVLREGAIPKDMVEEANVVTVLFVCTGNTCRSPMAAAMFRRMLAEKLGLKVEELGARGWNVVSAGTAAGWGGSATEEAEQAAAEYGAVLSDHRSRPVSVALVEDADRVYVMTNRHKQVLEDWMPEHGGKIQLLDPSGKEVQDPIGEPLEQYKACALHIRRSLEARLGEIA